MNFRRLQVAAALIFGASLLLAFPLYHHFAVRTDVLGWSAPVVWGPGVEPGDAEATYVFGPAERFDQGLSYLLRHASTRRLMPAPGAQLHVSGVCAPDPCSVEVRVFEDPAPPPEAFEASWPVVTFSSSGGESTKVALAESATRRGVVLIQVVRTDALRKRDTPGTRTVRLDTLEFRQ